LYLQIYRILESQSGRIYNSLTTFRREVAGLEGWTVGSTVQPFNTLWPSLSILNNEKKKIKEKTLSLNIFPLAFVFGGRTLVLLGLVWIFGLDLSEALSHPVGLGEGGMTQCYKLWHVMAWHGKTWYCMFKHVEP